MAVQFLSMENIPYGIGKKMLHLNGTATHIKSNLTIYRLLWVATVIEYYVSFDYRAKVQSAKC